jgi:hypothetical protein
MPTENCEQEFSYKYRGGTCYLNLLSGTRRSCRYGSIYDEFEEPGIWPFAFSSDNKTIKPSGVV